MNGASQRAAFNNGKPIVAIDIDGTISDYHAHFLRFAEAWYGRPMPDPSDINPGLPLHRFMGTSKSTYRQCKLAFRQGGLKRSAPVYTGARELTVRLRRLGAEVWICTTRPYLRLDNIDPDTRHWLRRHRIQFDAVLWGEHKYRTLARTAGPERVVAVLDDLLDLCLQARGVGLKAYLRDQPYNRATTLPEGISRVTSLEDATQRLSDDVRKWKENNG